MSGRLWLVDAATPPEKHDHFDLVIDNGRVVRLRDPRRFGLVLWQTGDPLPHPLLAAIGPEPLTADFDGAVLHRETRTRSAAIKLVIMDSHVVAGVGNIYANEALFRAGIDPRTPAQRVSRARCDALAQRNQANAGDRRSTPAAVRCATTSAATAWPEISRTSSWSTAAPENPARAAARSSANCARRSARPATARACQRR